MRFRRRKTTVPEHERESSWQREKRLERARQQRLGIAYYHLEHTPLMLELDATPYVLADLHQRLLKVEGHAPV